MLDELWADLRDAAVAYAALRDDTLAYTVLWGQANNLIKYYEVKLCRGFKKINAHILYDTSFVWSVSKNQHWCDRVSLNIMAKVFCWRCFAIRCSDILPVLAETLVTRLAFDVGEFSQHVHKRRSQAPIRF